MKFSSLCAAAALAAGPALADEVTYDVGGVSHTGYFAAAENPMGLVLIVHDWDGLTEYETRRADMLAEMGYDAFALDMFGEDTPAETMDHRMAATGELYGDREKMRTLLAAGLEQARGQSDAGPVTVMGYCFGGAAVLEMARSDMAGEAVGYATFHGGLSTPEGQGYYHRVCLGIPAANLVGGEETFVEYGAPALPTAYLLDGEGRIVETYVGPKPRKVLEKKFLLLEVLMGLKTT